MIEPRVCDLIQPAADGFPLSMRLISATEPTVAILISSGTGYPKGFYDRIARHLAVRGAAVLTYDYRGIAGSRPDELAAMQMDYPDWGRLDMPAALEALIGAAPGVPIGHIGHSVGGHFVGFMPNHARIDRHAFLSVGIGYWGTHHLSNQPLELAFWHLIGPLSLARHGFVKGGGLWAGADLPRGAFETWKRWCLKPAYFRDELAERLRPHDFEGVSTPIRSWVFADDPIANAVTAPELLKIYPNAPTEIVARRPSDYGVKKIGHDGVVRRGMEGLWDEVFNWLKA